MKQADWTNFWAIVAMVEFVFILLIWGKTLAAMATNRSLLGMIKQLQDELVSNKWVLGKYEDKSLIDGKTTKVL